MSKQWFDERLYEMKQDRDRLAAENAEMIKALEDIASGEIGINIAMRLAKGVLARVKAEK